VSIEFWPQNMGCGIGDDGMCVSDWSIFRFYILKSSNLITIADLLFTLKNCSDSCMKMFNCGGYPAFSPGGG
jgi:hypothetical protein